MQKKTPLLYYYWRFILMFFSLNYHFNQNKFIMKNKMKVFGLGLGVFAMSFGLFSTNPSFGQVELDGDEDDWICCLRPYGIGCTDKGGVFWPYDIKIPGDQETCTVLN
ncbi:MAG: hypothetical protein ACQEW9_17580 [Bacteroidota bacterium]